MIDHAGRPACTATTAAVQALPVLVVPVLIAVPVLVAVRARPILAKAGAGEAPAVM